MEKYRDIDEDELLKKLSEEELKRLEDELEELDPDVSLSLIFQMAGVSVTLLVSAESYVAIQDYQRPPNEYILPGPVHCCAVTTFQG